MQKVKIEPFKIIGISVRTTNENNQGAKDIGELWEKFISEGIAEKIPNKIENSVLSIYTNYEGDYTQPYDTILGCKVSSLDNIPDGMVGQSFDGGSYLKSSAKGDLKDGIIATHWHKIWKMDLDRAYTADFEFFGEKAQNPSNAEVDFYIAVNLEM